MIVRRRKKPVEVTTIQWTGANEAEVQAFTGGASRFYALDGEDRQNSDDPDATATVFDKLHSTWIFVYTGQHIVRGIQGELYPIAEDVLADTYDTVDETFFQPGHTYTAARYPSLRYVCEHVTTDPKNGGREAWGWLHRSDGTRRMERMWDADWPNWTAAEAGEAS